MVGSDLSSQPPLVVNPPLKKSIKSLTPMKTSRTMNPDSKNTIRHEKMLGNSSDIIFKVINTRSRSKRGDSVMAIEEIESWEDASDVSVGKEGLVDYEESSKLFEGHGEGISNGMDVDVGSNGSNVAVKVKMSNGIGIMPEIHVPIAENYILIPNFSGNTKPRSPTK
ncbi:hypothetical protein Tco_1300873, partial [Tanacetum coccineum]